MASVMALQQGWLEPESSSEPIAFVGQSSFSFSIDPIHLVSRLNQICQPVNDSFKNLRDSVNDGSTAAFMWEW